MSITVTPEDIANVAPEFAALVESSDETVEIFIDHAKNFVNESVWGEKKGKLGVIYMACHLMKEMGHGEGGVSDGAGAVTQERVGDLSKSYGDVSSSLKSDSEKLLATTKYGKMFLMTRKTCVFTPMVT
jgi:hypothetical protein